MKKDMIIRIMRILIGGGIVAYTVFFLMNNIEIASEAINNNTALTYFVMIIGVMILFMGILMPCIKRAKTIQTIMGLFLVFFSAYALKDNPSNNVFIGDILKILGAFLVVAGPLGLCVPEKCKQEAQDKKTEVIEV